MNLLFSPSHLHGTIQAVPSKSASHRAIICAGLANGTSRIDNIIFSKDIYATIECLKALGAKVICEENAVVVTGASQPSSSPTLPCCESGSTLRFLIPVAAVLGCNAEFIGEGRLPSRPITPYLDSLPAQGIAFDYHNTMPFSISGRLKSGIFTIPGNISSQFITGLMFALPLCSGDSEIIVTGEFESRPYVQMTADMLEKFGIHIDVNDNHINIKGSQTYSPANITVEGDFSQAAFFLVLGAIGTGPITVNGLDYNHTSQGDRMIVDLLKQCGADVLVAPSSVTVSPSAKKLMPFSADVRDIPDLVPIMAILAACCDGTSNIHHAQRLKLKESDRLQAVADLLHAIGGQAGAREDGLTIQGTAFRSGTVFSMNDHRIAMAAAVASSVSSGDTTLLQAEAVEKSYPGFYRDYQALGGICRVIDVEQNT